MLRLARLQVPTEQKEIKMKRERITFKQYRELVEQGKTTHLHNLQSNRASTIEFDGRIYSADKHAALHRYDWQSTASGNVWFYADEDGNVLEVRG